MKGLFAAAVSLQVLLGAAEVHPYFAESNWICSKCEQVVDHIGNGLLNEAFDACRDGTGKDYTDICSKLGNRVSQVKKLAIAGRSSTSICSALQYCDPSFDLDWSSKQAQDPSIIDAVNNDDTKAWVAGVNEKWKGATLEDVRQTLGSVVDPAYVYSLPEETYNRVGVPTSFDSRTEWPNCASIAHVRDQSACGSCWAFGSTEAYNDRLCIANQTFAQLLSTEDTTGCCNFFQCSSMGCNGGQPTAAWEWFASKGVVSGGDYDDMGKSDTCSPYSLAPCAHHVDSDVYPACPSSDYSTPSCKSSCRNSKYGPSYSTDKHKATKAYSLRGVSNIMSDISQYGTATAAFTVYEDFVSYTSGVYEHTSGSALGGHAIKIFGWGTEGGKEYWWCANSWNESWGDNGFFKILKGVDECGIESQVSGGHAA